MSEDERRPWFVARDFLQQPLLRLWDRCSGSRPESDGFMLSRAPRERLDTADSRVASLKRHIDNSVWIPTPYISLTTNPTAIEELADSRDLRRRGPHKLTAIGQSVVTHQQQKRSKTLSR